MNVKGNAKSAASERKMQDALLTLLKTKPLNRISVKELCGAACVNRTTFYAHYLDIRDLMQKLEQRMVSGDGMLPPAGEDAYQMLNAEYLRALLAYFRRNAPFYRHFFENANENSWIIQSSILMREQHIAPYIRESYAQEEIVLQYEFCKSGFIGVVSNWLANGCREPDELVANLLEKVLHKCMR